MVARQVPSVPRSSPKDAAGELGTAPHRCTEWCRDLSRDGPQAPAGSPGSLASSAAHVGSERQIQRAHPCGFPYGKPAGRPAWRPTIAFTAGAGTSRDGSRTPAGLSGSRAWLGAHVGASYQIQRAHTLTGSPQREPPGRPGRSFEASRRTFRVGAGAEHSAARNWADQLRSLRASPRPGPIQKPARHPAGRPVRHPVRHPGGDQANGDPGRSCLSS